MNKPLNLNNFEKGIIYHNNNKNVYILFLNTSKLKIVP